MSQVDRLAKLKEDLQNGSDEAVVAAAKELLELGEFGEPAGSYPLLGAKSAFEIGRLADAAIFIHHGLRVAEPHTPVWADLLVNRAVVCAHHGFCRDAIEAGRAFFQLVDTLPAKTAQWVPYAHHAVGCAYDKMKDYASAITHYRLAVELHVTAHLRALVTSDLAYALVHVGQLDQADQVLAQVGEDENSHTSFAKASTTAFVRYHQQRFDDAVAAAERAEALAARQGDLWAAPLAELWYWHSKAIWELGNRFLAADLALRTAITAEEHRLFDLRDMANEWLAEILDKGGIHSA